MGKTGNYIFDDKKNKVYLSYQPNDFLINEGSNLDSANPETAIVLINDKVLDDKKVNRYLIFRGDHRKKLEKLYPNIKKLKKYWIENGGHFWSDTLNN